MKSNGGMFSANQLLGLLLLAAATGAGELRAQPAAANIIKRVIVADVVALDQPWMWNRLGAAQPGGMIFALRQDVVANDGATNSLLPGQVMLRPGKRPRPLVLRMNVGDCLEIHFQNLLSSSTDPNATGNAPPTRYAGAHINGLSLVDSINDDGSYVGGNASSMYPPDGTTNTYRYYASAEGSFLLSSGGEDTQTSEGLFGAVNVQPETSEYYRSQVTHTELEAAIMNTNSLPPGCALAPDFDSSGRRRTNSSGGSAWLLNYSGRQTVQVFADDAGSLSSPDGHPVINYGAIDKAGQPVLSMLKYLGTNSSGAGVNQLVAGDLTAIITGPRAGRFPDYLNSPSFMENPASPDRRQPYREVTTIYHDAFQAEQAFQEFSYPSLTYVLGAGGEAFAINYGSAAIGTEILANRLGVGPMGGAASVDLKFEEFFLSSWADGDPAMVTDVPANSPVQVVAANRQGQSLTNNASATTNLSLLDLEVAGTPDFTNSYSGQRATVAYYPDDPSNVYHSYMRDHVKFRVLHAGKFPAHVHHQHAHQWLHTPNSDDGHYLDSILITPGVAFTLEMVYGGSGNRNLTAGDSIFHCHFYPHFAAGMWALWRVHDVFEAGTVLDSNGAPVAGFNRALPDAEITRGTPIPAVIPLPTLGMAPLPALVMVTNPPEGGAYAYVKPKGVVNGIPEYDNPGFPFFIPGRAGHRAPHPPLDFAWKEEGGKPVLNNGKPELLDGGLPRHVVTDGVIYKEAHNRWDFSKDFVLYDSTHTNLIAGNLVAYELPEDGTAVERAAMKAHSTRNHATFQPNGAVGNFILNGLPPAHGAPFAPPDVDDQGNSNRKTRRYQAAVIQTDVVLNKLGWHYPQSRLITLWSDVQDTLSGKRAPEPFFFRANSGETVEFWHCNLVPNYFEMDDFQIRTPTDIIGQHIHLVKFDVLASDGAANGWNYEDGTFSPDEVRERVYAINQAGGIHTFDEYTQMPGTNQSPLTVQRYDGRFGPAPSGQNWDGNQTTIQLWETDPQLDNRGVDRTLRTVFTHDHFGPSTHQQAGLYGGLLVEPAGSRWLDPATGLAYGTNSDGGPTGWQANVVTKNPADSYREFALEFQDAQLAYGPRSKHEMSSPKNSLFTIAPVPGDPYMPANVLALITQTLSSGQSTGAVAYAFGYNGTPLGTNVAVAPANGGWLLTNYASGAPPQSNLVSGIYRVVPDQANSNAVVFQLDFSPGWSDPSSAIAAPPYPAPPTTPTPNPTLITSAPIPGTLSLNYRNEPLPSRVDPLTNSTLSPAALAEATDLAYVFSSIQRANTNLNWQPLVVPLDPAQPNGFRFPSGSPFLTGSEGAGNYDPYTPLMRAYQGDRIQVRTLVGAHHNVHSFQIQGVKWFGEPTYPNSGYRNVQGMGISEHFEMLFELPESSNGQTGGFADYPYIASADSVALNSGLWGLLRAYSRTSAVTDLQPLPNNPIDRTGAPPPPDFAALYNQAPTNHQRSFNIMAITVGQLTNTLAYNSRGQAVGSNGGVGFLPESAIINSNAIVYVEIGANGLPVISNYWANLEPLVLRVAAGDWVKIELTNACDPIQPVFQAGSAIPAGQPFGVGPLGDVNLLISTNVGLHPQLVAYDVARDNGINAGFNQISTVKPGENRTSYWYAGNLAWTPGSTNPVATPVEFGAINLVPADMMLQHTEGLVGALIVEPAGSHWSRTTNTSAASATVTSANGAFFRELVAVFVDDPVISDNSPAYANITANGNQPGAVNYRSEPEPYRYTNSPPGAPAPVGQYERFANLLVDNLPAQTAVFPPVNPGDPLRFRLLFPGGSGGGGGQSQLIDIHGHSWPEEPFVDGGRKIGANPVSQVMGSQQVVVYEPANLLLGPAGGPFKVPGDYLYEFAFQDGPGIWGYFTVGSGDSDVLLFTSASHPDANPGRLSVAGTTRRSPTKGTRGRKVTLFLQSRNGPRQRLGSLEVDAAGAWQGSFNIPKLSGDTVLMAESEGGGVTHARLRPVAGASIAGVVARKIYRPEDIVGSAAQRYLNPKAGRTPAP